MSKGLQFALHLAPAELAAVSIFLGQPLPETLELKAPKDLDAAVTLGVQTLMARGLIETGPESAVPTQEFRQLCACLFTPSWALLLAAGGSESWTQAWHIIGRQQSAVLVSPGALGTIFCQYRSDALVGLAQSIKTVIVTSGQDTSQTTYRLDLEGEGDTQTFLWTAGLRNVRVNDQDRSDAKGLEKEIFNAVKALVREQPQAMGDW